MEILADHEPEVLLDEDIDIKLDLVSNQSQDGGNDSVVEDISSSTDQNPIDASTSQIDSDNGMIQNTYSTHEPGVALSTQDDDLKDMECVALDHGVAIDFLHPDAQELDNVSESPRNNSQNRQEFHASSSEQERYSQQLGCHKNDMDNTSNRDFEIGARLQNPLKSNFDVKIIKALREEDDLTVIAHKGIGAQSLLDNEVVAPEINSSWSVTAFNEDEANGYLSSSTMERRASFQEHNDDEYEDDLGDPVYSHPVVIVYRNDQMLLFPPVVQDHAHSQTYFLHDESYAKKNIKSLLGACRTVLAESIEDEDELEITIEELGLCISESTTESITATLSQIIHLYTQLQHYDGVDNPKPLRLILETRIRFSHRYNYLLRAVDEGKGLSQLLPLKRTEEENEDSAKESHPNLIGEPQKAYDAGHPTQEDIAKEESDFEPHNFHQPREVLSLNIEQQYLQPQSIASHSNISSALADDGSELEVTLNPTLPLSNPAKLIEPIKTVSHSSSSSSLSLYSEDKDPNCLRREISVSHKDEIELAQATSTRSSTMQGEVQDILSDRGPDTVNEIAKFEADDYISVYGVGKEDPTIQFTGLLSKASSPRAISAAEEVPHSASARIDRYHDKRDGYEELRAKEMLDNIKDHSIACTTIPNRQENNSQGSQTPSPGTDFTLRVAVNNTDDTFSKNLTLPHPEIKVGPGSETSLAGYLQDHPKALETEPAKLDLDQAVSSTHQGVTYNSLESNLEIEIAGQALNGKEGDTTEGVLSQEDKIAPDQSDLRPRSEEGPLANESKIPLVDADEITYEDDENDYKPLEETTLNINGQPSLIFLKRTRSDPDDVAPDFDLRDVKRFCS